ncbi:platelet glycoprotein VI-like isoform X1 [Phascolarctos cinereus]|uniref:Platelet glycoprotein VI-like isoform X1 n=1 Tax=Phascolarctos cinereus TaxID=38626 RepID=A0A6P5LUT1_PHACI|nr:platelet glycoprotein VI-like isoform X1 [Phascolarctos cinereus]
MGSFLLTLLSFGLCLSLGITAQIVTLSKPILWAKPRSMVAWGTDVILWCQGPPGVDMYRLERLDSPNDYKDQPGLPGTEARARFPLGSALASVAGRYRCSYRNGSRWSQPSNQLELIVTGLYDKPSFSILPGTEVSSGENVTFSCSSKFGFNMFTIAKEGRAGIWRTQEGLSPVYFSIPTVTASHNGTYQCYGFDSHFPHLWTAPSEPLELRVKGIPQPPSPRESNTPTGAPTSPHIFPDKVDIPIGLTSQDYTVSNLVRLVLAGLTVAALGVLLAEAWRAKFHMLSGSPSQAQGPTAPQVKGLPL